MMNILINTLSYRICGKNNRELRMKKRMRKLSGGKRKEAREGLKKGFSQLTMNSMRTGSQEQGEQGQQQMEIVNNLDLTLISTLEERNKTTNPILKKHMQQSISMEGTLLSQYL